MAIVASTSEFDSLTGKTGSFQSDLVSKLKLYKVRVTTGSDNYVTGGLAVSLKGAGRIKNYVLVLGQSPDLNMVIRYDSPNEKIQIYTSNGAAPAALAELNNTSTACNNKTFDFIVFGY